MLKLILILQLTFMTTVMASEKIELLSEQPIAAQIGGSCYAYAGNELLTGAYAKKKGIKESIPAPHPLLVAAFSQKQLKEGFVSGGNACDYMNEAKDIKQEICSYNGLESYLTLKNDENQKGERYYQDELKKFDDALTQLVADLDEDDFDKIKISAVKSDVDDLNKNLCEMSALGVEANEVSELLNFAQDVIKNIQGEKKRNALDRFHELGIRLLSGQKLSDAKLALKMRDETQKQLKQSLAPLFLRKFYEKLNTECLKKQKELDLPAVPVDFFTNIKDLKCNSWLYYQKNLSEEDGKKVIKDIEAQLEKGYPTPIGFCGSIFEGKSKSEGKDIKSGKCIRKDDAHFLTVVGFKSDSAGRKTYKIKNSWGHTQCESFDYNLRECQTKGLKDCPDSQNEITCSDGYYYMSENFIKNQIINYTRLENK